MTPLSPHAPARAFGMKCFIPMLAAWLATGIFPARAAVIYSSLKNLVIPTDFTGIYLDLDAGTTATSEFTGWDINPFFGGVGVANSTVFQPARTGTANTDPILGLAVGATVDGSRLFSTGYGGSQTHLGTQFTAGQEGYLGFKFTTNAAAGPYYGWMRVVFTGNTAGAVIKDWAYENAGTAIVTARVAQSAVVSSAQVVTLSPGTGESFTLGSALTNTGGNINSLVKTGLGTTSLTATNTYTGGTTVSGGVLALGSGGALGTTGTVSFGGGTLQFSASNKTDYSARFSTASGQAYSLDTNAQAVTLATALTSNGGALTKSGAGTLTLSGANTYTGGTTVSGGVLALGSSGALGSAGTVSFGGGTLQFSASNTTDYSARFSTAASQTYSLDTNAQAVTLATALTSAGGALTKSGTGTLTLSGANSYAGTTTVNAGTLLLNKSSTGALAATSALALGGGTFSILGKTGANVTTQTMASLAVNVPGSSLVINPNVGTSTTLTITSNTVTRPAGGTVNFDTSAGTPATALIAWNPTLTVGIIGGGFTIKDNGGTGFATIAAGKVTRFTGGTVLTASNPSSAGTDFRTTTAGTITNTVVTPALNSLTIDTTTGASIWDLGNKVASITTGGLLMTGASNFTIQNGSIQSTATNQDLIVNQYGAGTLTISAAVAGGASASLVKTGSGKLILNGAQTYNSLTASAGTTSINGVVGTAPGLAAVTVSAGATAKFGSVSQKLASLTIGAGATVTFTSGAASFTDSGESGKALSFGSDASTSAPVPEPGILGLLMVGALGVLGCRRRRV